MNTPPVEVIVFDGVALVHMIATGESKIADYANNIFIPRVFLELEKTQQIEEQELVNEYLAMETSRKLESFLVKWWQ